MTLIVIIFLILVVLSFTLCIALLIANRGNNNVVLNEQLSHDSVDTITNNEIVDDEII